MPNNDIKCKNTAFIQINSACNEQILWLKNATFPVLRITEAAYYEQYLMIHMTAHYVLVSCLAMDPEYTTT